MLALALALAVPGALRQASATDGCSGGVCQEWVARYDGPASDWDAASAVAVDVSGNVYVTGASWDEAAWEDYATIKYNASGDEQWVARYNGPASSYDMATAVAVDGDGNVYVTGYSAGSDTSEDYATVKYNADGDEQWVARYNNPAADGVDSAWALAVDSSGNVYVTGRSWGGDTMYDYATVKYDADGDEQWVARYNNAAADGGDDATAVGVDGAGNVYVTGSSLGSGTGYDYASVAYNSGGGELGVVRYNGLAGGDDFAQAGARDGSGNGYVTGGSWGGDTWSDYATVKYDADGVQQWVARYDGPDSGDDIASAVAVDISGNVYVTGDSWDEDTKYDYATVKYNADGDQQWAARYDGPASIDDSASALTVDGSGNVYVTGACGVEQGEGTISDYATVKYDAGGDEQWVARYDGPATSDDQASALAVDGSGNVYVTGQSVGSDTGYDYATIKYSPEGTPTPTPTLTPTPTPTATPPSCIDRLGDTECDDPVNDPDDDGCSTAQEVGMGFDPGAWYDFYDVPVPAKPDSGPGSGANGVRNKAVTMADVLAVLFYMGTSTGHPPNANGVSYDSIKGVDEDGDTTDDAPYSHEIPEGQKYDRSPSAEPNPPWNAGPPNGAISAADVLAALIQAGLDCGAAPGPPTPPGANTMAVDADGSDPDVDATWTYDVDEQFEVAVDITAAGEAYAGYDAKVAFDPAVLAYADPPGVTYASLGGMTLQATAVAADGTVYAASGRTAGTASDTGQAHLIGFECISEGVTQVRLLPAEESGIYSTTLRVGGGAINTNLVAASITCSAPTPTPTPTATPPPVSGGTSPDTGGTVGLSTSMVLDASGYPVVAYRSDATNADLKVLHCGNADCTSGNSITSPDTEGDVGYDTSLALDANGYPVVSYRDKGTGDLKVLHCGNADCTAGNSITAPDSAGLVTAVQTSLALDAAGNPVISYFDSNTNDLKVMHCNDPNCAGGGESIVSPDTYGVVGMFSSLALDSSGLPVVSYRDSEGLLKVIQCYDANCEDSGMAVPDAVGASAVAGNSTSLALDANDGPVVAYYDITNGDLKVLHCYEPGCAGGDGEPPKVITSPDTEGDVGKFASLALDGGGKPMVSYYDGTNGNLKILHCGDADCTYDNIITSPDTTDNVGAWTSLALDDNGNPVVSYFDETHGDLKVYHGCPTSGHVAGQYNNPGWDPTDDGHEAVLAQTDEPHGQYKTGTGNSLYFADSGNDRIRKIDGDGIITTVVGGGTCTTGIGDGGPATDACLNYPRDVFLDVFENIYVADTDNDRIRVVNTQGEQIVVAGVPIDPGEIETVAGGGTCEGGDIGDGGDATDACLDSPSGVAVDDAGNIYIADTDNNRIRRVDPSGTITTIVGDGTASYGGDGDLAIDAHLNGPRDVYPYGPMYAGTTDLIIADTGNDRIRWVHGPTGIINTLAGSGGMTLSRVAGYPAVEADLDGPEAVASDASLAVFIADTQNDRILRFAFGEATVTVFAGCGDDCGCEANDEAPYWGCPATDIELNKPAGVAVGSLTYSDTGSATLGDIDPYTGQPITSFSNAAACNSGMATIDWAFVVLALGLILARRRIGAPLMWIQTLAGLPFRRRRKGRP
jgi:hypothetical protein